MLAILQTEREHKMSCEIRMQADNFFNAYRVLSESDEIMIGKLEKLSGKPLVSKTAFGACPVSTPSIVCLAFALELYIKELHVVLKPQKSDEEEIKAPRGHNILELFRKLPLDAQQEIRSYPAIQKLVAFYSVELFPLYIPQDKNEQPITDILERQIYKISDAFQKWRYSYESGTLDYEEGTALALIEAVKSAANSTRRQSVA